MASIRLALGIALLALHSVIGADDSNADSTAACPMEMRFFSDFNGCLNGASPIAFATISVDGSCHTVATNTSPGESIYSSMPGSYRAQCSSNGTLIFLDSACINGSCSSLGAAQCTQDESAGGSIFAAETGQLVQADTTDFFCETIYDSLNRVDFAIFGDCSLPGCMVDGVVNPGAPSSSGPPPTNVPRSTSPPVASTASPVLPTAPESPPNTAAPATRAPATDRPVTAAPISVAPLLGTAAPLTTAPIGTAPSWTPSEAPIVVAPVLPAPMAVPVTRAPIKRPTIATTTPTLAPTRKDIKESASGSLVPLLAGVVGGAAMLTLLAFLLLLRRRRGGSKSPGTVEKASLSTHNDDFGPEGPSPGTHEIWIDPCRDDVSTLDGGTLPGVMLKSIGGGDEPTASVNMDFDFAQNRYRSGGDERSRVTSSTGAFTSLSKLGIHAEGARSILADDDCRTFEQQFGSADEGDLDDDGTADIRSIDMARRIRPFEVRAPPGRLGMVLSDPPLGGVPLVRLLKPDSILAARGVQVGDRLISVNQENVTNRTALEVSNLMTRQQNHPRLLVFCRLAPPPGMP
jgi:PDZ domain